MLKQIEDLEDIAHATVFLASDKAKFITGQVLTIDGGRTDFLTHSLYSRPGISTSIYHFFHPIQENSPSATVSIQDPNTPRGDV